jgi:hypothetical protein
MKSPSYWKARALAAEQVSANWQEMATHYRARITELEDRLLASSLAELKAARGEGGFAMPPDVDVDDDEVWAVGPFGHDPVKLPPLTEAEAKYAREQGFIE